MARREEGACPMACDRRATASHGMDRTLKSIGTFGATTQAFTLDVSRLSSGTKSSMTAAAAKLMTTKME
jgi:hypothetical protein